MERAGEGENERDVVVRDGGWVFVEGFGEGEGMGGNAASQGGVVVDIEFEEVVEGVGKDWVGAIDLWKRVV